MDEFANIAVSKHGDMGDMSGHGSAESHSEHMMMNSFMTTNFKHYPVVLEGLHASTKGGAFAIFLLIVATAFVYKSLLFLSWCLEVKWFKTVDSEGNESSPRDASQSKDSDSVNAYAEDVELQQAHLPTIPSFVFDVFAPVWSDFFKDIIRLVLTFMSTFLVYILMLVAMTYVTTYFFAVILGITLAEVFFNRCKIVLLRRWRLKREIERRKNCPGGGNCSCGFHAKNRAGGTQRLKSDLEGASLSTVKDACCTAEAASVNSKDRCCCGPTDPDEIADIREREANERVKQRDYNGSMDVDLMPAEKFT